MKLSITIDNAKHAKKLKEWLSHVDFVRHVEVEPVQWGLAGVPAGKDEIEAMLDDCMAGDEGVETNTFFEQLHTKASKL